MTTRVIKLGGRAQGDPRLPSLLAAATADGPVVVVHGGGDEVSAMQRTLGLEPRFVAGRRVTSERDLDVVRMLLSGTINKRLVAQLLTANSRAVGVSGEDGNLLSARVLDPELGRVGRDVIADPTLLSDLLAAGWLPVVSPVARDRERADGAGLNVNGDDAAMALAVALRADELLFVADVEGVLDGGSCVPALDALGIAELAARGVIHGGMLAKLEAATEAVAAGVGRVRIGTLTAIEDHSSGTTVVAVLPVA